MSDTVSATISGQQADAAPRFLTPDNLPPAADRGFVHVPGGSQESPAGTGALFSFVSLSADFRGLVPVPALSASTPPVIGAPLTVPGGARMTTVSFDTHDAPVMRADSPAGTV